MLKVAETDSNDSISFTRKLSLSRHFRSWHSDLPVPAQLSFVPRTRKQHDQTPNSVALHHDLGLDIAGSDSDLSELSDSEEDENPTAKNEYDESVNVDSKLLRVYEGASCESKRVMVYAPKARPVANDEVTPYTGKGSDPRPAVNSQKRKYGGTDFAEAAVNAKALKSKSPRYVISPPLPAGAGMASNFATNHAGNGRPKPYDATKHDKRLRTYGYSAVGRDEIAMPFDAIYGLMDPQPIMNALPVQNPRLPNGYPMTFPVPPRSNNYPPGQTTKPPFYYSAVPTNGPNGPVMVMHPVFPNHPTPASSSNYDSKSPVIIETGRSRLLGYRMKTPLQTDTAHATLSAAQEPTGTLQPEKQETARDALRISADCDRQDDDPMEVDATTTNLSARNNDAAADVKRLRPLEIPSAKLWSMPSAVKVSEVRTSLESSLSKDSAATLVGSPADTLVVKGASAARVEDAAR